MSTAKDDALTRMEARQVAHESVMRTILEVLQMQGEKLDALLEAATIDPGPSPTAEALKAVAAAMDQQTQVMSQLPELLARVLREELAVGLDADGEDEGEPAEGAFEREAMERH